MCEFNVHYMWAYINYKYDAQKIMSLQTVTFDVRAHDRPTLNKKYLV